MKAIDHSIGAALQACASRAPAAEPQRLSTAPSRGRGRDLGAGSEAGRAREIGCDGQDGPSIHLTQRQLDVLALLCEGLQNKLICRRLSIASGTVKVHISCILRELGVASRLAAVVEAQRRGLVNAKVIPVQRKRDLLARLLAGGSGPQSAAQAGQAAAATIAVGSAAARDLRVSV